MEKNGIIYVNNDLTKDEFSEFDLSLHDGRRKDLEKAILFFEKRIGERYLNQINTLNDDVFNNGFTSMAICCLLIDTFYQFEHGVKKTTKNHENYVNFLRSNMGDVFDSLDKADRFYVDIRCGILHSAQTQNGSRLSTGQDNVVQLIDEDNPKSPISVDVKKMENRLVQYFIDYCDLIRHNETIQSNFVKKLNIMFK